MTDRRHRLLSLSLLAILSVLIVLAVPAAAQSVAGTAAMLGTVTNTDGKALAGATIRLKNLDTGYTRSVVSDANGTWSAPTMPVGSYQIDVDLPGFMPVRVAVTTLTVGGTVTRDVTMSVGAVVESLTVSAPMLSDLTSPATSNAIVLKQIENVPIRGRNFTEFVQLSPAVLQEPDRFGLVMSGQRSINSNISIDGADFNDPLQGNQRGGNEAIFFFPQTAVREFQIVLSGAGAEVGRTAAGYVNVVTKSGSNSLRGEMFLFGRSSALTSPDAFDRKLDASQNQYGLSLGGPIIHDRLFFFFGAEQNRLRVPVFVQFQQQAPGVTVPADLRALEGEFTGTNDPTTGFVRVDYQTAANQTINLNYTYGKLVGENFNFTSPQLDSAQTFNYKRTTDSNAGIIGVTSVFGTSMINDLRFQYATDARSELPNVTLPQITINGFGTIGGDNGRPRVFNSIRRESADTAIFSHGSHEIKTGFDINFTQSQQERETNIQGRYDFKSLSDYIAGRISRYRQTMPGSDPKALLYEGTQREYALFAEDQIDLSSRVTVTAGLRWEGQQNPQPTHPYPGLPETARIPNDMKMWQPRLGLAWNVGARGTTVVRLSAGIYSPRTPANLFQRVFTDNGVSTISVDSKTDPSVLKAITFPFALGSLPPGVKVDPPRVFGFASNFQNPRATNTAMTIEHVLSSSSRLSVGYVHIRTTHLQRRWDHNLFAPTIDATGMPIYPKTRPNPAIGWYSVNESDGLSVYDAIPITLERTSGRLSLKLNYTWSKNWDNDSNERVFGRETILNVFDPNAEWAPSKYDVRHAANLNVVYTLPAGFSIGGVLMARTGFPFTPVIGFDTQNDGNDDNDRAIINGHVAGRSSMRQPSFFDIDLRLSKRFTHLELTADWFNVTRAPNKNFGNDSISAYGTPDAPVATAGQPLFAPSTARYGGTRQVQLGARILF